MPTIEIEVLGQSAHTHPRTRLLITGDGWTPAVPTAYLADAPLPKGSTQPLRELHGYDGPTEQAPTLWIDIPGRRVQFMPAPDKLRFIRRGQPLVDEAERLAALPEPGTVRRRVQVDLPPGDHELVATQGELQVVNTVTIPRRS